MSDINTATAADTISNEIPIPVDSDPASSIPENVSETLYIQNLNEMIRIDGSLLEPSQYATLTISLSPQGIFARSLQVVR